MVGDGAVPFTREQWHAALDEKMGRDLRVKCARSRVAVCGLGGLGSNVAIALARSGVGVLHLIDFDRVEITNLNRQQYFVDQLGMPKAHALAENLKRIAPYCDLVVEERRIVPEAIPSLFDGDDIVCECFDKPEAKSMLVDGVSSAYPDKPLIVGSGMAGLRSANEIATRRVGGRLYLCGDGVSGVEDGLGLAAPRVLACAAHEALMVLRLIAGERDA